MLEAVLPLWRVFSRETALSSTGMLLTRLPIRCLALGPGGEMSEPVFLSWEPASVSLSLPLGSCA
jgi:hypothetical protein